MTDIVSANPVAHAVGLALLEFVWQGTVVGLLTALLLAVARRASAATRYVIACVGLAALTAAPIVTVIQATSATRVGALPTIDEIGLAATSAGAHTFTGASSMWMPSPVSMEAWLPLILVAWSVGVLWLTVRLVRSWLAMERLRRDAVRQDPDGVLARATARIAETLGLTREVRVAQSLSVDVPTVVGWIRPAMLFPISALAGLSVWQMEAVIAHELAHIRRHDYVVNGLQNMVETFLFYHPAVWWVSNQIRIEREHCCDDVAVAVTGNPVAYARALASLEESRHPGLALGLSAAGGSLLSRIRRVLGQPTHEADRPNVAMVLCAVVTVVALAFASSATPRAAQTAGPAAAPVVAPPTQVPAARPDNGIDSTKNQADAAFKRLSDVLSGPLATESAAPLAAQTPTTTSEAQVTALEEVYRRARLENDAVTLDRLLDPAFVDTSISAVRDGNIRDRSESLARWHATPPSSLIVESRSIRLMDGGAVVRGSETETSSTGTNRLHFVRVWKVASGPGWTLVSNIEVAEPRSPIPSASGDGSVSESITLTAPMVASSSAVSEFTEHDVVSVGRDGVRPPQKVKDVKPIYPQVARDQGLSGLVFLEALVGPDGAVKDLRVTRSAGVFDQAAIDAVSQWKYTPPTLNGNPVSVRMTITVNFQVNRPVN